MKSSFIKKFLLRILIYSVILTIGLLYYVYLLHHESGIPCLFQTLFHVRCLSCGSTSAVMALLSGDFLAAVRANPLFVLVVYPAILFFILQDLYVCLYRIATKKQSFSLIEKLFNTKSN